MTDLYNPETGEIRGGFKPPFKAQHYPHASSCVVDANGLGVIESTSRPDANTFADVLTEYCENQSKFNMMAAFIQKITSESAFSGYDIDGGDVQEYGEEYGVLEAREVTQEHLDDDVVDICEVGDTAYFFPDWLIRAGEKGEQERSAHTNGKANPQHERSEG